ncbi:MAG: hypothetical protein M3O46_02465, partial [Myxococcota bacterium]|nr:hypothetical protein [Myxococcota bacterium]
MIGRVDTTAGARVPPMGHSRAMGYADFSVASWRRRRAALLVCAIALFDCSFPGVSFEPPADEAGVEGGLAAQFGDHAAITDAGPTAHSDAPFFNGPGDAVSVSPLGDAHGEPLMGSADAGASAGDPSVLTDAGASESGGSSGGRVTGSSSSGSGSASGGTG